MNKFDENMNEHYIKKIGGGGARLTTLFVAMITR